MKPGENFADVTEVQQLERVGFSSDEITGLFRIKGLYLREVYNEVILERKHLEFARWLYRHGRLNEENV